MSLMDIALEDRFSVCEHVLRMGDLSADLRAAVAAGAHGIGLNASDFGSISPTEARSLVSEAGLVVSSYIDPSLMRLGPHAPDLADLERAFATAAVLGAPSFLFISGTLAGRSPQEADDQILAVLTEVAVRTAGSGVQPMLEPLHPIARELSFVHTLRHALLLARQVPGVGIVVDLGASWWEHELVEEVAENLDLVLSVQITGVSSEALMERRYVRVGCSEEGAVPVGSLIRDLVGAGYEGWFEHEVLAPAAPDDRLAMLTDDERWFRRLWA